MILTKISNGYFKGSKGATVTFRLDPRKKKATVKPISAAYGDQLVKVKSDGTIKVELVTGKKSFAVVYGCTVERAWLDMVEVSGAQHQKLRGTSFNPCWPTVTVWLKGV